MSVAPLTAGHLHEPIMPFAKPPLVVLKPGQMITQALEFIRGHSAASSIHYFYVVDDTNTLVGVIPARRLLTAGPEQSVSDIMVDNVVAIPDWATVLVASEYFATRRLLAFPVVNDAHQLLGVVDVSIFTDEVIDLAKRTYDDIFQLIGVHGTAQQSSWFAFRDRFPWLLCNIGGGLLAAYIASHFEHLLAAAVVLSLFIPIVLALAESVSMQALTLTMQGLTDGPIVWKRLLQSLWKEFRIAALLGFGCALVVSVVVFVWRDDVRVAGSIFLAISISMV
ncbi:MAG: CBS domain-containing protein, partial [Acidobacteriota bacterium]